MNRLEQVQTLFFDALDLPPEDRAEWLEAHCLDPTVREETSVLLSAHVRMSQAQKSPDSLAASRSNCTIPTAAFGAYRAVAVLGRGGMSVVYRAERADGQFEQTVALKVMAAYLTGAEFLHRFEMERQLLASLNHHNIARLLDGGLSSNGDPFLITEFIDGQTVDRYCDQRKLGVEARLRIFLQVCDAVDCAHRNLVVHRDLKPGNILVSAEGAVKLLDFGTASLLGTQTDVTATRARMLTPRYASPEQLRGDRVNTATDVFSLGVILYELLTGAWPFGDPNSILRELDRSLADVGAKPLSTGITADAAGNRSVTPEQLRRELRGDLSAIALKALEYDPERRYESVRALAADLENFLNGRPVSARPQTAVYRMRKFLRRRWLPTTAAAVSVLGLAGAAIVSVHQARLARAEATKAEKVNDFLNDMLSAPGQFNFDPRTFTVEQMLESAETRLEKHWQGDALTEATLRRSLGTGYRDTLRNDRARAQLEKSLAIFQSLGDQKEIAISLFHLAALAEQEGRSKEAVQGYEKVLAYTNRLGKNAPSELIFQTKGRLAADLSLMLGTRLDEAGNLLDEAIALGLSDLSISRTELAGAMSQRAMLLAEEDKKKEAEAMYRRALEVGRREDPEGHWQAFPLHYLALLIAARDPSQASELARQYYAVTERALGPGHAETASAKIFWMRLRVESGNTLDSAAPVLEAIEIVRTRYPPNYMNRWVALYSAVIILEKTGRFRDAEPPARELLPILDANHAVENDPRRGQSLFLLGTALHGQHKEREAAEALEKSVAIYGASGPNFAGAAGQAKKMLSEASARRESH
jgi:eukaryotic-like serine/threonine-protein kinase